MKSFLRVVFCLGILNALGVDAMKSNPTLSPYQTVMQKTRVFNVAEKRCEDVVNAYGGSDLPINWEVIQEAATEGDPVAQYCHAKHCLALATTLFNGKKIAKTTEAYVFMLISAIFGEFDDSRKAFAYVGDISSLNKEKSESDLLELASRFASE